MDSGISDNTPPNVLSVSGNRREPGFLGFLDAGFSPDALCKSSHFWGVENARPSFQLWVGTLAEYPQNIGLGKSFYKTEWTVFQNRKLPNHWSVLFYFGFFFLTIQTSTDCIPNSPVPAPLRRVENVDLVPFCDIPFSV